jgi:predicted Zn-ribbon and HTH transcriptional regulator
MRRSSSTGLRVQDMSECEKCGIAIPREQLSGLNTCPKCVTAWIKEYKSYHDRRYGKRVKV